MTSTQDKARESTPIYDALDLQYRSASAVQRSREMMADLVKKYPASEFELSVDEWPLIRVSLARHLLLWLSKDAEQILHNYGLEVFPSFMAGAVGAIQTIAKANIIQVGD